MLDLSAGERKTQNRTIQNACILSELYRFGAISGVFLFSKAPFSDKALKALTLPFYSILAILGNKKKNLFLLQNRSFSQISYFYYAVSIAMVR